jgi:hypothetical protein
MLILEIACGIVLGVIFLNFLPYLSQIVSWGLVIIIPIVIVLIAWVAIGGAAAIGLVLFSVIIIILYSKSDNKEPTNLKSMEGYEPIDVSKALEEVEKKRLNDINQ